MSTDPNREIVIRSVRRSWALLMKRLIHLSAEEEQPFPAAGGGACGDFLAVPGAGIQACHPPAWSSAWKSRQDYRKKKELCGFWEAGYCCFLGWNLL